MPNHARRFLSSLALQAMVVAHEADRPDDRAESGQRGRQRQADIEAALGIAAACRSAGVTISCKYIIFRSTSAREVVTAAQALAWRVRKILLEF